MLSSCLNDLTIFNIIFNNTTNFYEEDNLNNNFMHFLFLNDEINHFEVLTYIFVKNKKLIELLFKKNNYQKTPFDSIIYKDNLDCLKLCEKFLNRQIIQDIKNKSKKDGKIDKYLLNIKRTTTIENNISMITFLDDYKKNKCVICETNYINIYFDPCRHYLVCDECCGMLRKCPYCNTKLESKIETFSTGIKSMNSESELSELSESDNIKKYRKKKHNRPRSKERKIEKK